MDLVRRFLTGVIEASGGVVEPDSSATIVALLPGDGAAALGLPEEVRIGLDACAEYAHGVVDGRLGSPLVERLVQRRLENPAVTAVAIPPQLPRALPEHVPTLLNAVRRGAAERSRHPARYLVARVRLLLQADELRSTLQSVCIRLADGALVSPPRLDGAYEVAARPMDQSEGSRIDQAMKRWLHGDGPRRLSGALETLQRRARRDLERMAEYYTSLDAEMAQAARRARSDDERVRRQAKRAMLAGDLEARRAQLRERLKARLVATLIGATLVETDAERFTVPVRRRTNDRSVAVLYRADGLFEGPACAACSVATLRFHLCDERLHVLCDTCGHSGRLDPPRCAACTPRSVRPPALTVEDPTRDLTLGGG